LEGKKGADVACRWCRRSLSQYFIVSRVDASHQPLCRARPLGRQYRNERLRAKTHAFEVDSIGSLAAVLGVPEAVGNECFLSGFTFARDPVLQACCSSTTAPKSANSAPDPSSSVSASTHSCRGADRPTAEWHIGLKLPEEPAGSSITGVICRRDTAKRPTPGHRKAWDMAKPVSCAAMHSSN